MNIFEFTARTGYTPTEKQFMAIQHEYIAAGQDIDKDTFCKEWKKKGGIEKASMEAQREIWVLQGAKEEAKRQAIEAYKEIAKLSEQLKEAQQTIKELREQKYELHHEYELQEDENVELHARVRHLEDLLEKISNAINAEIATSK